MNSTARLGPAPAATPAAPVPALLDASPEATLVFGADRRCTYANAAAGRLFGCPPAELQGLTVEQFPATAPEPAPEAANAARAQAPGESQRQAERLGAMGSLLAHMVHELNNPLAVVSGRASMLEDKTREQPALHKDARCVREAADRCSRIVRTFLNMARQKPPAPGPVQLNELARSAAGVLAYGLQSHGLVLEMALDPALPATVGDGDQLSQVLMNLLVNAQQALMPCQPGERRLALATGRDAQGLWLRVADQGEGVPAALRERIFEPFFTTKPVGSGTGLGLALSRAIAREHGGDLVLEDAPRGASFLLRLPVRATGAAEAPAAPVAPGAVKRLLVVDDEPEVAEMLAAMLEADGHAVRIAASGEEALAQIAHEPFDAVLCDLHMPGMDGAALWRHLQAERPALAQRLMFVTGDGLSAHANRVLAQTGCCSLVKPFGRPALREAVRTLLREG